MTKQEILETWVEDFIQTIEKVNIELKQIDYLETQAHGIM